MVVTLIFYENILEAIENREEIVSVPFQIPSAKVEEVIATSITTMSNNLGLSESLNPNWSQGSGINEASTYREVIEKLHSQTDNNLNTTNKTLVGAINELLVKIESLERQLNNYIEVDENGFYIVDENMNIGFYVDSTGAHSVNLVEYQSVN